MRCFMNFSAAIRASPHTYNMSFRWSVNGTTADHVKLDFVLAVKSEAWAVLGALAPADAAPCVESTALNSPARASK